MSGNNQTPKKRGILELSSDSSTNDDSTVLDKTILNRVWTCPDPKALARCVQVCRAWKKWIAPCTWNQAAANVNGPGLAAITNGLARENKAVSAQTTAAGLAKLAQPKENPPQSFPDPTLRPEDLFLLIELEGFGSKKIELEGFGSKKVAWCKSFSEAMQNFVPHDFVRVDSTDIVLEESPEVALRFPPDVIETFNLSEVHSYRDKWEVHLCESTKIEMTLSMWRADTGETIGLWEEPDRMSATRQTHFCPRIEAKPSILSLSGCSENAIVAVRRMDVLA